MSKILKLVLLFIAAPLIAHSAAAPSATEQNNELKIHFMDVGHGDSTFINCPDGKMILIDAGSSSGFPGGKLRYYLLKQGGLTGKTLDTLVITHPDINNYNLVSRVLDKVPVNTIFLVGSRADYNDIKFKNWLGMVEPNRIKFLGNDYFNREDVPNPEISCRGAQIHVLAASVGAENPDINAMSIALMIKHGNFAAILPGDATTETEDVILKRFSTEWLQADILKASNYGSLENSNSIKWLKTVKPQTVVISSDSQKGDDDQLKELSWFSPAKVYSTAENGNVVVTSDGKSSKISVASQK